MNKLPNSPPIDLYQSVRVLLLTAKTQVRQTVNTAMVQTYWHIGRLIVEDEQGGAHRAESGKQSRETVFGGNLPQAVPQRGSRQ